LQVYTDISKRFPTMPFSVRQLGTIRELLGLKESVGRGLVVPFPSDSEPVGELVAQYRFTALLHNGKTVSLAEHEIASTAVAEGLTDLVLKLLATKPARPAKQSKWTTNTELATAIAAL
jgi:hypothetical protein